MFVHLKGFLFFFVNYNINGRLHWLPNNAQLIIFYALSGKFMVVTASLPLLPKFIRNFYFCLYLSFFL